MIKSKSRWSKEYFCKTQNKLQQQNTYFFLFETISGHRGKKYNLFNKESKTKILKREFKKENYRLIQGTGSKSLNITFMY